MKSKKLAALMAAAVMSVTAVPFGTAGTAASAAGSYNYAEALQKSMFFYEVQQSGVLPEWNSVHWRADSMVDEDGVETDFVPGGWFDAGDHFKFTLTNAYAASILAWGYIEYKDAVDAAGLGEVYRNNVKWGIDYVLACDQGGGQMVGTIGDFTGGSTDHNIWCSAEVYLRKHHLNSKDWVRPYDIIENASVAALSAAALAEGYIIFGNEEYLTHAKDLFDGADRIRDSKDIGGMSGMYDSSSWLDDAMYAACWLYRATGDKSYLDKIEKDYIPNFPKESQSDANKYTWGLCWDDTSQGAALLYAQITGDSAWVDHVSHHLDYWIDGYGGKKVDYTPDGLAWLFNWGSARHATTTCWLAKLASDTIFKDNASLAKKYDDWAKGQMDYIFGDNGLKMSYVLGMGDNQPSAFHHRTASGIHDDHWNDLGQESAGTGDEEWQTEYAHTLYGALVGGPDKSGSYKNSVAQYEYSEVAIDYNAGYTAALCAMVDDYGGEILADFPPTETPKWAEWKVAAVLNGSGASYTEIKAWAMNHTAWPARVQKDIEFRYFFDVSEVLAAGLSVDDITVEGKSQQYDAGEQGYATVSGPHKYSDTVYYASIKFEDGRAIQPTGQSEHRDEVQFRVSIPDAVNGTPTTGAWDPSNDWSYKGVEDATSLKKADSLNEHFTMYVNGALVWGEEPDGTTGSSGADLGIEQPSNPGTGTPSTGTTAPPQTTAPSQTTTSAKEPEQSTTPPAGGSSSFLYGDADCSGFVDVSDAVLICRVALSDPDAQITEQGKLNADCDGEAGITSSDAVRVVQYIAGLIGADQMGKKL